MQMSFVEFLEGLARVAEKISLVPEGEFPEDYTDEERIFQPLHVKIEALIYRLQNYKKNDDSFVGTPQNSRRMSKESFS